MNPGVKPQYLKRLLQGVAIFWLGLWGVTALFSAFLATSLPWKAEWKGQTVFPAFSVWLGASESGVWRQYEWKSDARFSEYWMAPVPFSPNDLDFEGKYNFDKHILGTDELGRDVLSCLIHGAGTALITGFLAVLISMVLGLLLGGIAGYCGDHQLKISLASWYLLFPFGFIAWYYGIQIQLPEWVESLQSGYIAFLGELMFSGILVILVGILGLGLSRLLQKKNWFRRRKAIWVDILILRLIEIKQSIPTLFLILAVVAITEPGVVMTSFWIGITGWTGIARFVRAEMLRIREAPYMIAAYGLGFSERRILLRHALPNALSPIWALVSFAIAGAILSEASLSFIREPAESISWGSLLSAGRKDLSAWWLALWPGLALFLTLFSLQLIGERLRDYFDPRQV